MTIKLVHTEGAPANKTERTKILVMGQAARGLAAALLRLRSTAEICAADTGAEALEFLRTTSFDHVLVDNRDDGALALTIPALARVNTIGKLTVLAGPESAQTILGIPGVDDVIQQPYNPVEIAKSLDVAIIDSRTSDQDGENLGRRESDNDTQEIHGEVEQASADNIEEEDTRPVLFKTLSALARLIPGLTPVLSLLYKNTALTLLGALFVAFISYGVMIAYFLIASDWSSPLQLQRGHETVIKVERELGELRVKRNLVLQQLADAEGTEERAKKDLERAEFLAQIVGSTLDQEIENQKDQEVLVDDDIEALEQVLESYGSKKSRQVERDRLRSAFKRRIITRRTFQQSMLNLSQIEENIVNLNERVSRKRNEQRLGSQTLAYLTQLKSQLDLTTTGSVIANGKAEFIPIANQVIEVQQIRAAANSDLSETTAAKTTLRDSVFVLSNSIKELESTPMFRALEQTVNVLFVPYGNLQAYEENEPLYTCAFAIFWCSKVGAVGGQIPGEITTTHPFFGKPIRGQFVEANLTETSAAQEEIIHVGRPPLFF